MLKNVTGEPCDAPSGLAAGVGAGMLMGQIVIPIN
jgi:hypothetical protein